jgi:dipeptidyl aminopeptidase/acylaminoacyl peptidase
MTGRKEASYGSWTSPITSEMVSSAIIHFEEIHLDGRDIYWAEIRPAEKGRTVIVHRSPDGKTTDVTPSQMSARTTVHEYGGGHFAAHKGVLFFSNFSDQRLYRQERGGEPRPITPEGEFRYADGVVHPAGNRLICVREEHGRSGAQAANTLVEMSAVGGREPRVLASGNDFYASPRLSPDGSLLAWITWNHPNMPWDGTQLWIGALRDDGSLADVRRVAGGPSESIFQPEWSPDGVLHFVSDRTGWWNLYRWENGKTSALSEMEAEFGRPQWVFGKPTYGFESADRILCSYTTKGSWCLARLEIPTRELTPIPLPFSEIESLRVVSGRAAFFGGSPTGPNSIVELDLETLETKTLRRSMEIPVDADYLSSPEPVEFPTEDGLTAHAFFYPPKNRDYAGSPDEKPPLLVVSHGGPTSASTTALKLGLQYWTSRGFAVLDVNYGGSTGYGRSYRDRLKGRWGVVDVDDCANGARYLVERGLVDPERLGIRGGSAGGYTTLCALTFRDTFKIGASYFGVSDLEALAKDTHKLESRYLDTMIGPYPEQRDLYRERSPINYVERLSCPVIFLQGLEDKVVPPSQAELMVGALREKGVPVAYVPFEGEQHGFRRSENIKRALESEFYFCSKMFAITPADSLEPVAIDNL